MRLIFCLAKIAILGGSFSPILTMASNFENIQNYECSGIDSYLPKNQAEKEIVDGFANYEPSASLLRYLTGDDSWFGDYYNYLSDRKYLVSGIKVNDTPAKLKEQVSLPSQIEYIRALRRYTEMDIASYRKKYFKESNPWRDYAIKTALCRDKDLAENTQSEQNKRLDSIVEDSKSKLREDKIGYFNVKIKSCSIARRAVTNNPYTEPKQWPGSRFVIIDVEFKNLDNEGRLPVAGALIVKHKGRELRYDTTEAVNQEGFGIYFKSVNPLVTMPTKIVYRIPDEVGGEMLWEPGRNSEGKSLWCAFANSQES
jgi:hypothetical protein